MKHGGPRRATQKERREGEDCFVGEELMLVYEETSEKIIGAAANDLPNTIQQASRSIN